MKNLLERLNALRGSMGKKALTSWKESKAKLEAAISKVEAELKASTAGKIDRAPPPDKLLGTEVDRKPAAKVADAPKAEKAPDVAAAVKKAPAPAGKPKVVTLSEIAGELKIDDKVARAKMRRLRDSKAAIPACVTEHGWTFAAKDAAAVKALLQADGRGKNTPPAKEKASTAPKASTPKTKKASTPKVDDKTEYKAVPTGDGTKHTIDRAGKRLVGTYVNLGRANIAIVQMRKGERDWEEVK